MDDQQRLAQMAQEDVAMQEMVQTAPPQTTVQTPDMDKLGLNLFEPHMSPNGFNTFLSLVHWALLCQRLSDGDDVDWSDEVYAAQQAAFVGFGNAYLWDTTYSGNVAKLAHEKFFNWHLKGPKYRKKNRLSHKFVSELATVFANTSKGWHHARMIADLVEDPATYEKL